nr:hypothetical protein [Tanacetum cinerariifolium]
IAGRRRLLTHGMELAVAKCLNSLEYLSALGKAIGKAIEKVMQDGLTAGITHGKEGHILTDVAAHNPFTEVDYVSALQQLHGVNFSLLAELKSNKDASIEALMNILFLKEHLAERLDVFDSQVRRIKDNIMSHKSLFQDVFILLAEPFSDAAITGTEGTSDTVPATADTTAALSVTFASASIVDPISIDDFEVIGMDDQPTATENFADANVNPFSNVDDAELNIP